MYAALVKGGVVIAERLSNASQSRYIGVGLNLTAVNLFNVEVHGHSIC